MRDSIRHATTALTVAALLSSGVSVYGQSGQPSQSAQLSAAAPPRQLSVDEAVRLALDQNLGIQIERINPQIQDVSVAQARNVWTPNLTSSLTSQSRNNPSTNALSGGQTKVTDSSFATQIGLNQSIRTGANYSISWNSSRASSTNIFSNYEPQLGSNVQFNITQPLLRNYKIDTVRQQIQTSQKDREASDVQLASTIALTTRNVKDAYWDLAYQIANLGTQQQSLDLAKRLLADNEKRVQIGTMAPIDVVEAQSEVARNEEAVIVAEAAIRQAEDRLRTLIFDPAKTADFWSITLEPTDTVSVRGTPVDVDGAVRRALGSRSDVALAKNSLSRSDISIRYFKNQTLPDVSAQATYISTAAGGTQLQPLTSLPLGPVQRSVLSQRSYGSVLGDVLASSYPTWTVGVNISYPIGNSSSEASLVKAKLQYAQAETQLKNIELQIAAQVRDLARQVQTNQKRIDSARAARELAERRLDAEEKKFAAGIQTSFFVFQAQRDLAQARTVEIRAYADYQKSLVDFEAIQEVSLTGTTPVTSVAAGAVVR